MYNGEGGGGGGPSVVCAYVVYNIERVIDLMIAFRLIVTVLFNQKFY